MHHNSLLPSIFTIYIEANATVSQQSLKMATASSMQLRASQATHEMNAMKKQMQKPNHIMTQYTQPVPTRAKTPCFNWFQSDKLQTHVGKSNLTNSVRCHLWPGASECKPVAARTGGCGRYYTLLISSGCHLLLLHSSCSELQKPSDLCSVTISQI